MWFLSGHRCAGAERVQRVLHFMQLVVQGLKVLLWVAAFLEFVPAFPHGVILIVQLGVGGIALAIFFRLVQDVFHEMELVVQDLGLARHILLLLEFVQCGAGVVVQAVQGVHVGRDVRRLGDGAEKQQRAQY